MQTALVLGAGQIGTFAARRLAEDGATVVAADVLPAPRFFARFGPPDAELAAVDVCDAPGIIGLIRRCRVDVVVLTAALSAAACRQDPARAWLVNGHAPEVVADAALAAGASRLVFVSSFAVYGQPAVGPICETARLAPRSVYGRSKAAAEAALARVARRGLDVRIVRPCAVYGPSRPGFGSQSTRLIDRLLLAALDDDQLSLTPARAGTDEYIYVKDLARALSLVALEERASPQASFNIGSGSITDLDSLCRAVEAALPGCRVAIEPPEPEAHAPRFPLDVSRIRGALGFQPRYDLARGMRDYLDTVMVA